MALVNQDIELWSGDDTKIDVVLTQADGTTPIDLTNVVLRWTLLDGYDRSHILVEKVSGNGIDIVDLVSGSVQILVAASDTRELGGQLYLHQLLLHDLGFASAALILLTGSATIHTTAIRCEQQQRVRPLADGKCQRAALRGLGFNWLGQRS
jgi:hypothetical protein